MRTTEITEAKFGDVAKKTGTGAAYGYQVFMKSPVFARDKHRILGTSPQSHTGLFQKGCIFNRRHKAPVR